jgi:hypothetical protein
LSKTLAASKALVLSEWTRTSGGLAYVATTFNQKNANDIFKAIASELRSQYTIAIEPQPATGEKKFQKIKLKVTPPADAPRELKKLTARTREGFYASQNPTKTPEP